MNRKMKTVLVGFAGFCLIAVAGLSFAADTPHQHGDTPSKKGQVITEKKMDGYALSYTLLNLEERKEVMKGMEGMKMHGMSDSPDVTHHLVVRVTGPDGKPASAKIGFNITHPDGSNFKTLTMAMNDAYGADVLFKTRGRYKIEMKAVIGSKTLNDEIGYEVK